MKRTGRIRRLRNRRQPDKRPGKAWAALWKACAKERYRSEMGLLEWGRSLEKQLEYLESRVSDYPILGILLKQARGE